MTIRYNNYSSQDRNKVLRAQGEEQRKKEEENESATSTSRDSWAAELQRMTMSVSAGVLDVRRLVCVFYENEMSSKTSKWY